MLCLIDYITTKEPDYVKNFKTSIFKIYDNMIKRVFNIII